jgi:hypothetical protein
VPAVSNVISIFGAFELTIEADALTVFELQLQLINAAESESAVPLPVPTPVAVKTTPTVLLLAPIEVKFVDPRLTI